MAERILKRVEHKPLRDLAQKISNDQKTENSAMEALITGLNAK